MWQPEQTTGEALLKEERLYDHGFSEEQVLEIRAKRAELDKKLRDGYEVTIDDMKNIIVPFLRIHRTEEFILKAPKEKPVKEKKEKAPKQPKAPKEQKPKAKKISAKDKKDITLRLQKLIAMKAAGMELTDEQREYIEYAKGIIYS